MIENLTIFDGIAILLILILGIKGVLRGFIKEFFGLVGIIGGIYIGSRYAEFTGNLVSENLLKLQNETTLYLVGFIVTFLLFWILAAIIGATLSKIINSSGLGIVNKILGFLIGGAKIFLIFSIIIFVLSNIVIIKDKIDLFFKDSFMYPIFYETGSKIVKLDENSLKFDNLKDNSIKDIDDQDKQIDDQIEDPNEKYRKFFE